MMEYVTAALWLVCAITTPSIITYVWRVWSKERRLPLACHYEDLQACFERKERELKELLQEKETTLAVIKDKRSAEIDLMALNDQLKFLRSELAKLDSERKKQEILRQEIDVLEKQLSNKRQVKSLEDEIHRLTLLLNDLKDKVAEERILAKEESHRLHILQNDRQRLLNSITIEQENLSDLKRKAAQWDITLTTTQELITDLHEATKNAKTEQQELTTILEKLTQECEEKREDVRHLLSKEDELSILLDKLYHEQAFLKLEIERQKQEMAQLANLSSGNENGISRLLTTPQLRTYYTTSTKELSEEEALLQLQNFLKNEGLHYDTRTLYSFHTSLKVIKQCPLVILAGISGTGKSLLANCYAKAMGLHFLSMAVQPRWDSPQDLFGYYDFTKKQFQATELSRALLQMNRHNRGIWEGITPMPEWVDDNLLMVLLDEMNIARVEHYFSVLLSKLETRRDCEEDRDSDREKAEIVLEGCMLPTIGKDVRLFIDYNILLVGTLNDDESTLNLSDKILDRANVIHFGKPSSFPDRKKTSHRQPSEMLSFEVWKKWIRGIEDLPAEEKANIEKLLLELNNAMAQMGKAFAHRTNQAIMAYMANYPRNGSTHWHHPFADQVAQKLMSRLRGVDTAHHREALNSIEQIVGLVGDDALLHRFIKAKEAPYFDWK